MRIVLDTNVVVSAMLYDASIPGQVLDLCVAAEVGLVVDDRILAEYRDVLARTQFKLDPALVAEFFVLVESAEHVIARPLPIKLPDPSDVPFLEVAVAGGADALVTGNAKDFKLREGRLDIAIVTPREFIERLRG